MHRPSAREVVFADRPLIIAHRGDSRRAPENTLPAFVSALESGVDAVELDYVHSRDGAPVVFHDDTLDRTTDACRLWGGADLPLEAYDLARLKQLDAGAWFDARFAGVRIPTLEEALEPIQERAIAMIERKRGDAGTCLELLRRRGWRRRVTVHSLDWQFLRDCRRLDPELLLGALGDGRATEAALDEARELGATIVGWNDEFTTPEAVQAMRARGLKCWVWTVDDPSRARELVGWGANGIITNVPVEMLALRGPRA